MLETILIAAVLMLAATTPDNFRVERAASIEAPPGETVVFSWIVYKSRAHRDRVNAKVMKDPRIAPMMDAKTMPFDGKRLIYGGFKVLVVA